MLMLPLFALLRRIAEPIFFSLHSFLLQKSLYSGGLQLPSPPLGLKRYFRPLFGGIIRLDHLLWPPPSQWRWYTYYFPSLLPWHLLCSLLFRPILLLGGASGPEFWSPTNSTNRPSFSVLSPQRTSPLSFQKARCDDFAFYFDSHCPSAKEYSSIFLSLSPILFTSLTLKALLTIRCSGLTVLFLSLLEKTALAYFPTALFVA